MDLLATTPADNSLQTHASKHHASLEHAVSRDWFPGFRHQFRHSLAALTANAALLIALAGGYARCLPRLFEDRQDAQTPALYPVISTLSEVQEHIASKLRWTLSDVPSARTATCACDFEVTKHFSNQELPLRPLRQLSGLQQAVDPSVATQAWSVSRHASGLQACDMHSNCNANLRNRSIQFRLQGVPALHNRLGL